jgi:flagellar biogenesis protein FliO
MAPSRALALLVLVAVVGGVALLAKKRWSRSSPLADRPRLSVLDTVRVAEKSHLVLARVGERCVLLGVTPHSVRRIAWLRLAEGAAEAQAPAQPGPEAVKDRDGFPGLLRQAFVQDAPRPPSSDESPAVALAALTRDNVDDLSPHSTENLPLSSSGPRARPQAARGRGSRSTAAEAKMASLVEAQASGLTARRRR